MSRKSRVNRKMSRRFYIQKVARIKCRESRGLIEKCREGSIYEKVARIKCRESRELIEKCREGSIYEKVVRIKCRKESKYNIIGLKPVSC